MYGIKRVLSTVLTGALLAGLLGGCAGNNDGTEMTETTENNNEAVYGEDPLVIGCKKLDGNFNPFFAEGTADKQVLDLTSAYLLGTDRAGEYILNGIEGETKTYNGTPYTYTGIADCAITESEKGEVSYDVTLREDVRFSDGTLLTADDLIFTMYVYLDPSYDGDCSLNTLPIKGLSSYWKNMEYLYSCILAKGEDNTDFSYYTEDQQKAFYKTDWPAAKKAYIQAICDYCNTDSIGEAMVEMGYAVWSADGDKITSSFTLKSWTMEEDDVPGASDFWNELQHDTAYLNNFDLLMENMIDSGVVEGTVYDYLPEKYKVMAVTGESAGYISGIKKTGEYSVRITLTEASAGALDALAFPVQPLHYYGEKEKYDYDEHKFGFTKGDLLQIRDNSEEPLGAGPYRFVEYSGNTVYLAANSVYWKGAPQIAYIQCTATADYDMALDIVQGVMDLAEPSIAKSDLDLIRGINSNGQNSGNVITMSLSDYSAYGYIGINSRNVCVGDDPSSQESKYLRTAIATVLAEYRYQSVHNYYGDTAVLVDYPISRTSWAYVDESDSDYVHAFSTDINGNAIYDSHKSLSERRSAVLSAALEYFKAAGYTVEDGKLTEAPEGAQLGYKVLICGKGEGDHPSYELLTQAAAALKKIGFTLTVQDVEEGSEIYQACLEGEAQLWCAAWPVEEDPDSYLSALYSSSGSSAYMYRVYSEELDGMLEKAASAVSQQERRSLYKKCLNYIAEYAVEVPVYQRQTCTLYRTERIDTDTIVKDATANYNWMDEIERLKMN